MLSNLFYDARAHWFGLLSWYPLLHSAPLPWARLLMLARIDMALYPALLLAVAHRPLHVKAAVCYTLFVALSRAVYEQYLVWSLPFLIPVALRQRSRLAFWLCAIFTVAGMVENEQTASPFDPRLQYGIVPVPCGPLNLCLALSSGLFVVGQIRTQERDEKTSPEQRPTPDALTVAAESVAPERAAGGW